MGMSGQTQAGVNITQRKHCFDTTGYNSYDLNIIIIKRKCLSLPEVETQVLSPKEVNLLRHLSFPLTVILKLTRSGLSHAPCQRRIFRTPLLPKELRITGVICEKMVKT